MLSMRGVVVMLGLAAFRLQGQDNYEIQVYGAELVPRGATMFELHSNYTRQSGVAADPGMYSSDRAYHETLEITHGFTDFFELGYYNFTAIQPGRGYRWVGTHLRPRFSVPERWHWPVGVSLSQEFGYQRSAFSRDTWTWEFRPIIDQKIGRFYWSINPVFGLSLKGEAQGQSPEFAPNVQVNYDVSKRLNLALEYYGSFGPVSALEPFRQTEQELFPAINYDFGPGWEFNLGAGIALTNVTDRVLLKMIVGRRIGGTANK
jgi:hypothetical protein